MLRYLCIYTHLLHYSSLGLPSSPLLWWTRKLKQVKYWNLFQERCRLFPLICSRNNETLITSASYLVVKLLHRKADTLEAMMCSLEEINVSMCEPCHSDGASFERWCGRNKPYACFVERCSWSDRVKGEVSTARVITRTSNSRETAVQQRTDMYEVKLEWNNIFWMRVVLIMVCFYWCDAAGAACWPCGWALYHALNMLHQVGHL